MAKRKPKIQHAGIVERFAARLRELRQLRGLTQAELARQSSVALSHLSKLESGEAAPGIDLLERLAGTLGRTVTDMLPAPSLPDAVSELRERTKRVFDGVVERADDDMLNLLHSLLTRLK